MNERGMVIIGAGTAGAWAAVELRKRGWEGGITLIGNESRIPYDRPPLSKEQLQAEGDVAPVPLIPQESWEPCGIAYISGDGAVSIDRDKRSVKLESGCDVPYEKLLLATGANPRKLATLGNGTEGVQYLRRFDDALRLREQLQPGKRVAVIGGGFIGLEAAASASAIGCRVTLIEAGPRILRRGVPEAVAQAVHARHAAAGVEFRTGAGLERVDRTGEEYVITLADGTTVSCDLVIAGIGAVPETALAAECGLDLDNGIKVNERLETGDPHIYAAGDCCSFPHERYGGRRIRLEAWRNAQDQGLHAAASMRGDSAPYAAIPWFWSDQYELKLQVAGLLDGEAATVERDLGESGKLYFHLADDGSLLAASGIGTESIGKEIRVAEMMIEKKAKPAPESLRDPKTKLKSLLRE